MIERSELTPCQKAEGCLDANKKPLDVCVNGRDDLLRYVETTPLVHAERLCIRGLLGHRESRASSKLVDNFANICFDIDRAIAIPRFLFDENDDVYKDKRMIKQDILKTVVVTLGTAPSLESVTDTGYFPIVAQMKRIGIFIPAFRARMSEETAQPDLVQQIHSGLCEHIAVLDKLMRQSGRNHDLKKQISAHMAECEVMALHSRVGELPYPALSREEASHARKQHNHDYYTLGHDRKKPYQVKTSSSGNGYSKEVAVIQHYYILKALRRDPVTQRVEWKPKRDHEDFEWPNPYRYDQVLTGEAPSPLSELLLEEQRLGKKLPRDMKNALNLASHFVRSQ